MGSAGVDLYRGAPERSRPHRSQPGERESMVGLDRKDLTGGVAA